MKDILEVCARVARGVRQISALLTAVRALDDLAVEQENVELARHIFAIHGLLLNATTELAQRSDISGVSNQGVKVWAKSHQLAALVGVLVETGAEHIADRSSVIEDANNPRDRTGWLIAIALDVCQSLSSEVEALRTAELVEADA